MARGVDTSCPRGALGHPGVAALSVSVLLVGCAVGPPVGFQVAGQGIRHVSMAC